MKCKFVLPGIAFLTMIVAAPTVSVLHAQGNGIVALANGSGQTTSGGQLRTFTFTAKRDSANVSSGQAELFSRASGVRVYIDINCLNVVGTTATMSGTVSTSNQTGVPFLTGDPVWFTVVDNGHGTNSPPDLISYIYIFSQDLRASHARINLPLRTFRLKTATSRCTRIALTLATYSAKEAGSALGPAIFTITA